MGGVSDRLRESRDSMAEVFHNPGLRRVNLALGGSEAGNWAYGVAVSVYAYLEGGPATVGVLGVVRFVLIALLAPFVATLADRHDRLRLMIGSNLTGFVLVVIAAGVIAADGPPLAVYALAVLASLANTAFRPAQAALIPKLARHPGELTAANVAASTIESVAFFVGPALAGGLLVVADIEHVYLLNAASFLWSAAVLRGVRQQITEQPAHAVPSDSPVTEPLTAGVGAGEPAGDPVGVEASGSAGVQAHDGDGEDHEGFLSEVAGGFRVILSSRDLRLLIGLYAAQTVVAGASMVFTVAIALDLLELGEAGAGLLDATIGVGGLVGGVVALVLAQGGRLARDFGVGVVFWAAPLLLVAAFPELWAALVAMVVIGLANSVVDVNAFTILQRLAPDEVMGRVFGAMESIIVAGMAVGSLAMPLLMVTVGLRASLLVIGLFVMIVAVLGFGGLARIDRTVLAPEGLELLRSVPILAPLGEPLLDRLARVSSTARAAAGEVILAEGGVGDRFYVIEEGTVEVTVRGEHVRFLGVGDSFGEIALLRDVPRTASVRAVEDVVLRSLDRADFVPAVTGHGDAARAAEDTVGRWLTIS
jgi:MFS family permease